MIRQHPSSPLFPYTTLFRSVLETFAETSPDALEGILERADRASRDWRRRPVAERAERLWAAARLLRERKDAYARTMALEMGKPLAQGAAEAEKCAWACDYYAEHEIGRAHV